MPDIHDILDAVIKAERKAGELVLHAGNIIARNKTDGRNVVTEYDLKVQKLLQDALSAAFSGTHFFCEESDNSEKLSSGTTFIIDPIDGTMNFVKGFNHSCISVACCVDGEVLCSAVYNPFADEMFTAVKGEGAFLNGERIFCGSAALSDSVVCVGTAPYRVDLEERTFRIMQLLFHNSLDIRRQGSAELDLCSVASGRAGLYYEENLCLWDYAAGYLLVNEAGGVCVTAEGGELPFDGSKSSLVAGTKNAVRDCLSLIKG